MFSSFVDAPPAPLRQSNPFATRYVRPGAIDYWFPPDVSAEALVARLKHAQWCGAIRGPHGTGKSTLLASLLPWLKAAGRDVQMLSLHDGQRSLPAAWLPTLRAARGDNGLANVLLVVDGYEQLGRFARWRLQRWRERHGAGLLVTTHGPARLPVLWETSGDPKTLTKIVERLLAQDSSEAPPFAVRPAELRAVLDSHQGNMRESLFALYDLFEAQAERNRSPGV